MQVLTSIRLIGVLERTRLMASAVLLVDGSTTIHTNQENEKSMLNKGLALRC